MNYLSLDIQGLILCEPSIFCDERGEFFESFHEKNFSQALGYPVHFVQDNQSVSKQHVLRGLHYQVVEPQGKLVRVVCGEIFDVAVDLRPDSPSFGQWVGEILSHQNQKQLWIPEGFAHGFLVLSETATVMYKVTRYWNASYEHCLRFDDPDLKIAWPIAVSPLLSDKDRLGLRWEQTRSMI